LPACIELSRNNASLNLGIYVHIPFCRRKCRYCDFYSITPTERLPAYLSALGCEVELISASWSKADTLYFGGGTPSLLTPRQLEIIMDQTRRRLSLLPEAEISLEINPGAISLQRLRSYAALGCNRLTIGIQSLDDNQLSFLGRIHDARQALKTFQDSRKAGFSNIGMDLIYGLPGQTAAMWQADLEKALALQPEHISCYMLSFEPRTALYADLQAGKITPPAERHCADLFCLTHDWLTAHGYQHYEISNFAKSSQSRSRHNQKYWNPAAPYLGLGASAHSYDLKYRCWNHPDMDLYLQSMERGELPRSDQELLTREQQQIEAIYLGLRQSDGIDALAFNRRFDVEFEAHFGPVLEKLTQWGWLTWNGILCQPTLEGMLFQNRMVGEFIELID
jgi:putative oxygen-independent coproporphyrinogen III oxidase